MKLLISGDFKYFWCPGCECAHGVNHTWTYNGAEEKPTFSPSLLSTFGKDKTRRCHLFVENGMLRFLKDCTHQYAGQTVEIPDWPFED